MAKKKEPKSPLRGSALMDRPHDALFQVVMGVNKVAREFLDLLPPSLLEHLDVDTVESTETHFVSEELRHLYSDNLLKIRLRTGERAHIYLLNEHLSKPHPLIAMRLAEYTVAAWKDIIRNAESPPSKLPLVIPVLIYNGPSAYPKDISIPALMDVPEALLVWSMTQPVIKISLSEISDERLAQAAHLGAAFMALKHAYDRYPVDGIFIQLQKVPEEYLDLFLTVILNYIMKVREEVSLKDLAHIVDTHLDKKGGTTMTIAEQLRAEGAAGAEKKANLRTALNFINSGLEIDFVLKNVDLSRAELEKAIRENRASK